jgi:hypothetical protein
VHLRPPSIDHGVVSFVWGVVLGGFVWLFLVGIGVSSATGLILGLLTFGAVFLLVRLYGGDEPGR